ncbi:MAG: glycosyltransferase family 2 protein [Firmicutes bacterium]|nr:glycosyltransferase family 2 protein [Bacillota bacterium]
MNPCGCLILIAHYRKLGANRFFIVDNNSADTTRDFLLKQPDVHLFFIRKKYAAHWRWME